MWTLETPWYELIARGTLIYFFMLIIIRLWGKKHLGEMTIFDFILLLFISEAVQNSLVDDDKSILGGMIVVSTFLLWNTVMNRVTFKYRKAEKVLAGEPKVIINEGKIIENVRKEEYLTYQELYTALRLEGVDDINHVKKATIETNGHISVVERQ